ncbi:MAG: serine/threonine-protein kinase [Planctomycetaceae bacterium]
MKFFRDLFRKKTHVELIDLTRRFDLIARIGQGSMSKVWRSTDTFTGQTVAVKVLDLEKTERFESRFTGLDKPSEGEIAVQLEHPNIVETMEFGWTRDHEQFLVMEFIDGLSLSFLVDVQNTAMKTNRMKWICQLGDAVSYLHENSWIHRDICPRNVLIDSANELRLIDFGLVVPNTHEFQKPGNRTGTASYMAPELIRRQSTDPRIDIFSYAVTCFEMFARRLPWDAIETLDAVRQRINIPPKDIRTFVPDIDEQTADALMKGLEPDPADRWPNINDMLDEFVSVRKRLEGDDTDDPT